MSAQDVAAVLHQHGWRVDQSDPSTAFTVSNEGQLGESSFVGRPGDWNFNGRGEAPALPPAFENDEIVEALLEITEDCAKRIRY